MQTVAQIFEKLGGHIAIAEKTGIPLTTVHSWKRKNFVPDWRKPALISLAKKAKVALSEADFPSKPVEPYRPKQAA